MKKQILIISITVIIVSIFISCSANNSSETVSTVSVKNESIETVTDSKEKIVITESITEPTAKKFEETTSVNYPDTDVEFTTTEGVTISTTAKSTSTTNPITTKKTTTITQSNTTTQKTTTITTTTQKQTQPVTDKDGWINKWY